MQPLKKVGHSKLRAPPKFPEFLIKELLINFTFWSIIENTPLKLEQMVNKFWEKM